MLKEKEFPLILYFYEKDKSVSLEQVFAKLPLEERGDKNKRNYFIDRGGIKFFFQLNYDELEKSWGLEIGLDDDDQIPTQINYLIIGKVLPFQNPIFPNSEINKYIKELHFYTKKIMNISE